MWKYAEMVIFLGKNARRPLITLCYLRSSESFDPENQFLKFKNPYTKAFKGFLLIYILFTISKFSVEDKTDFRPGALIYLCRNLFLGKSHVMNCTFLKISIKSVDFRNEYFHLNAFWRFRQIYKDYFLGFSRKLKWWLWLDLILWLAKLVWLNRIIISNSRFKFQ